MWPEARWRGPDGVVHIIGGQAGVIRTECIVIVRRRHHSSDYFRADESTEDPATCLECIAEAAETVRAMGITQWPWDGVSMPLS